MTRWPADLGLRAGHVQMIGRVCIVVIDDLGPLIEPRHVCLGDGLRRGNGAALVDGVSLIEHEGVRAGVRPRSRRGPSAGDARKTHPRPEQLREGVR